MAGRGDLAEADARDGVILLQGALDVGALAHPQGA